MLHFILDFATLLFFKIPIALLLLFITASFFSGWFGGAIWLWMIGLSILGAIYIKEEFDKSSPNQSKTE